MYQADPSVIISGKLGDKKKLFPSANIIMFLVLNEKALEDLKHNSDSLSHLHSQLVTSGWRGLQPSPLQIKQVMSISAEGSVKGK